jgi:hypothetical protein
LSFPSILASLREGPSTASCWQEPRISLTRRGRRKWWDWFEASLWLMNRRWGAYYSWFAFKGTLSASNSSELFLHAN